MNDECISVPYVQQKRETRLNDTDAARVSEVDLRIGYLSGLVVYSASTHVGHKSPPILIALPNILVAEFVN